jgi:hypothetical protein
MAEIDKALPNENLNLEEEDQEVFVEETKKDTGPVDITEMEDGGAEVNFDPNAMEPMDAGEHFSNLAEVLPDTILDPIGSDLSSKFEDYKSSRSEWEKAYTNGLELLGFKYEARSEPFRGASGATHPVLAEAVTQFQALAYKELLPSGGPVRTQVVGKDDMARKDQAERVKEFMNYQIMHVMKEYEADFDQMLFYLPLAGSTFKKVYYDQLLNRAVSKFIPADDLVVPYSATSLDEADTVIHVVKISENDLRKQQVNGFYRDIELSTGYDEVGSDLKSKERELGGVKASGQDEDMYTLLECHVNLDLEGFEDMNPQSNEPTGIKLPYIVTIEEGTNEVLSIRRNFAQGDVLKKKVDYFVHFKFLPGLGFYGFGLIHMIGGLSRTATAALRQLLDAGTLSNLPAGFKMRGIRVRDEAQGIQPGEFRDVDAPGGNLRDAFMPLPFKEPSQTLLTLMSTVVSAGQRFASIADTQVGDGNQGAAVGTTVALLERGSRVMSAIHKRLYSSLKQEFSLLSKVFSLYLPPEYPYDVVGGQRNIKQTDFDDRVDILPIADPNIFSQTQRISIAQTELQMAMSNPKLHNLYQAYHNMYSALGIKDINSILPPPAKPAPMDPSMEHIQAMSQKSFQAFPKQDHRSHIDAHLNFMATNMVKNNPLISSLVFKNVLEHISLMAQEQIQIEFAEDLMKLQQMQMQMQQNPQMAQQMAQNPELQRIQVTIEARKAVLIADMTKDFMQEEKKIADDMNKDPLIKLKAREVDLKAKEEARKEKEGEEKSELDRLRLISNRQLAEDKLEQSDEHQKLRAGVSLAKSGIQKMTMVDVDG